MSREAAVMREVGDKLGLNVSKTPPLHSYDYAGEGLDGALEAVFEVKCRTNSRMRYPTYMLSLMKFAKLIDTSEATGKPAFLVVSWTDGICLFRVCRIDALLFDIKAGGRKDRGDPMDIEPCIFIPVDMFVPLEKMGRLA